MNYNMQLAIALQIAYAAGYYIMGNPECTTDPNGTVVLTASRIAHRNGNEVSKIEIGVPVNDDEPQDILRIAHYGNGHRVSWDFRLTFEQHGSINLTTYHYGRPGFVVHMEQEYVGKLRFESGNTIDCCQNDEQREGWELAELGSRRRLLLPTKDKYSSGGCED
jgi:hypothetical protein